MQLPVFTSSQLDGLYAVAYRFLECGDVNGALHAFRVMVRFAPTDERGWIGLGSCHEQRGEPEVATELFGAGAVASSSARCLIALARLRATDGDHAAAIDLLDDARELAEENSPDLLSTIAVERGALS